MYKKKCDIIQQIQSYHKEVAILYYGLYVKTGNKEMKSLLYDLYEHEMSRFQYLEKHKKIAEAMKLWLDFPCDKLSNQISVCLDNLNTQSDFTMEDLIKLELYFDDCLIKLYNILASENELSETVNNTFYYMLKKTKKEKIRFADMLNHLTEKINDSTKHESLSI